MRLSSLVIASVLVACVIIGGYAGDGDDVVTREKAISIAKEYLKKNRRDALYRVDEPIVTENKKAFTVQFNMVKRNVRPGVCIIEVDRCTGAAKIVPVE